MKHLPLLLVCVLPFAACGKSGTEPVTPPKSGTPAPVDDHGHGTPHDLGTRTVGAHSFELVVFGTVEAGHETAIELHFPKDKTLPGTVRAWLGVESGEGSEKSKVGKDADVPNGLHGHLDAPKPLPAGSKLWIEIEDNGKTDRAGFDWK